MHTQKKKEGNEGEKMLQFASQNESIFTWRTTFSEGKKKVSTPTLVEKKQF